MYKLRRRRPAGRSTWLARARADRRPGRLSASPAEVPVILAARFPSDNISCFHLPVYAGKTGIKILPNKYDYGLRESLILYANVAFQIRFVRRFSGLPCVEFAPRNSKLKHDNKIIILYSFPKRRLFLTEKIFRLYL